MTPARLPKESGADSTSWSDEEARALHALLNLLIPPDADSARPGAAQVGFEAYAKREGIVPVVREGLRLLADEAERSQQRPFRLIGVAEQAALVAIIERRHGVYFRTLLKYVVLCYYQDARVLRAVGADARPPFPDGFAVADGDLTLLESVLERGPIYRF